MTCLTGLLGCCLASFALVAQVVVAQPVITYDQRQEGRVNVQVDVKDLQIVAIVDSDVLGDYNYDYALYDEADFTVKPSTKRTTPKPSSTTIASETSLINASTSSESSISTTVADLSNVNVTTVIPIVKETTLTTIDNSTEFIKTNVENAATTKNHEVSIQTTEETTTTDAVSSSTLTSVTSNVDNNSSSKRPATLGTAEPRKRCPTGFQMRSGRCFKRRHSLISPRLALMKLAPTLLGKSRLLDRLSMTGSSRSRNSS